MKYIATGGGYRVPDYPFIENRTVDSIISTGNDCFPIEGDKTIKFKYMRLFYQGKRGVFMLGDPDIESGCIRPSAGIFNMLYTQNEVFHGESTLAYPTFENLAKPWSVEAGPERAKLNRINMAQPYIMENPESEGDRYIFIDLGTKNVFDLTSWKNITAIMTEVTPLYMQTQYSPFPVVRGGELASALMAEAVKSAIGADGIYLYPCNDDFEPINLVDVKAIYEPIACNCGCLDLELIRISQ